MLGKLSIALVILMPVIMSAAHRSSPLVLGLAALLALASLNAEERRETLDRAKAGFANPLGLFGLAFFVWCFLSLLWSDVFLLSLHSFCEFWLTIIAVFVLALVLPQRLPPQSGLWALIAFALAALIIIVDMKTGLATRKHFGMRSQGYVHNRPVLTLLMLAPPLLLLPGTKRLFWTIGAGACLLAAIFVSESGAAKWGLLAAIPVFALALWVPRTAVKAVSIAFPVMLAIAPVFGEIAHRLIPQALHERLAGTHSQERVEIWRSFGSAILIEPFMGAGFGASATLDRAPIAMNVPEPQRVLLGVGHPHNAPIQIWVELGLIGALLVGVISILVFKKMALASCRAPLLALAVSAFSVSLVGQGAWQGWWPAAIGASIVWFRFEALQRKPIR